MQTPCLTINSPLIRMSKIAPEPIRNPRTMSFGPWVTCLSALVPKHTVGLNSQVDALNYGPKIKAFWVCGRTSKSEPIRMPLIFGKSSLEFRSVCIYMYTHGLYGEPQKAGPTLGSDPKGLEA